MIHPLPATASLYATGGNRRAYGPSIGAHGKLGIKKRPPFPVDANSYCGLDLRFFIHTHVDLLGKVVVEGAHWGHSRDGMLVNKHLFTVCL
jgi:hypothetical protein